MLDSQVVSLYIRVVGFFSIVVVVLLVFVVRCTLVLVFTHVNVLGWCMQLSNRPVDTDEEKTNEQTSNRR